MSHEVVGKFFFFFSARNRNSCVSRYNYNSSTTIGNEFFIITETLSDNLRTITVDNAERKNREGAGDASFDEIIGHIEDLLMGMLFFTTYTNCMLDK